MRSVLALTLACVMGACGTDVTQLVVAVGTEHPAQEIGCVKVRTGRDRISDAGDADHERILCVTDDAECDAETGLPFSFAVLPSAGNENGPARIEVEAVIGDCERSERTVVARVHTRFLEGRSLRVPIYLSRSCENVRCGEDETCDEGRCVPAFESPERFPPLSQGNELDGLDSGPGMDAGTDDAGDAASEDAPSDVIEDADAAPADRCRVDPPQEVVNDATFFDVDWVTGSEPFVWEHGDPPVWSNLPIDGSDIARDIYPAEAMRVLAIPGGYAVAASVLVNDPTPGREIHVDDSERNYYEPRRFLTAVTPIEPDDLDIAAYHSGYLVAARTDEGVEVIELKIIAPAEIKFVTATGSHPVICVTGEAFFAAWQETSTTFEGVSFDPASGTAAMAPLPSHIRPRLEPSGASCWLSSIALEPPTMRSARLSGGATTPVPDLALVALPQRFAMATLGGSTIAVVALSQGSEVSVMAMDASGAMIFPELSIATGPVDQLEIVGLDLANIHVFVRRGLLVELYRVSCDP